jgi:hypothetical protein
MPTTSSEKVSLAQLLLTRESYLHHVTVSCEPESDSHAMEVTELRKGRGKNGNLTGEKALEAQNS